MILKVLSRTIHFLWSLNKKLIIIKNSYICHTKFLMKFVPDPKITCISCRHKVIRRLMALSDTKKHTILFQPNRLWKISPIMCVAQDFFLSLKYTVYLQAQLLGMLQSIGTFLISDSNDFAINDKNEEKHIKQIMNSPFQMWVFRQLVSAGNYRST